MALPAIIFFFLPVYTLVFIIIIVANLIHKRKILWVWVAGNLACIGVFFYLQNLVENHTIIFSGEYTDGARGWGSGMANAYITLRNEIILVLIFCVVQVFFWIIYKKRVWNYS